MPNLKDTGSAEVTAFLDYLHGKESDANAAIAATARHVHAYAGVRSSGSPERWPSIEAMKSSVLNYGPNCTVAQFEEAYAAFVAS